MPEMKSGNAGVGRCSVCGDMTLHKRNVQLKDEHGNFRVLVIGRCAQCDTMPCPNCKGRTIDPTADKCKHCQQSIALPRI